MTGEQEASSSSCPSPFPAVFSPYLSSPSPQCNHSSTNNDQNSENNDSNNSKMSFTLSERLGKACDSGDIEEIRSLLQSSSCDGVNIAVDDNQNTPLHICCMRERYSLSSHTYMPIHMHYHIPKNRMHTPTIHDISTCHDKHIKRMQTCVLMKSCLLSVGLMP